MSRAGHRPGDVPPDLPPQLKARLFAAFDIAVLWNKPGSQATVRAEITETTLQAVPAILDPSQDGYDNTHPDQPAPIGDLANTPRTITMSHPPGWGMRLCVVQGVGGVLVDGETS